jgi:hypothetical protein
MDDNIKDYFKETGRKSVNWIHLVNFCEYGCEPSSFINDGEFLDYLSDS